MERFGTNTYGENLYRIVLASSRRSLVHGQWNDAGTARARWCLTYPHIGAQYILEKWLDAFAFTGCTAATWNVDRSLNVLGPYPNRGEYVMCGDTSFNPGETNIEKLIVLIEAGSRYSWAEKLAACRDKQARVDREKGQIISDIVQDAFRPFGGINPISAGAYGRGTKTTPVLRSANELGLPIPQGKPGEVTVGGGSVLPNKRKVA